jgi:hypothetical protein
MGVFERTCELRLVLNTLLRLVSGIDFVLTSIYCLLAFLPYTFFFLIKAPPYSWMPWFVRHQATLYPVAATAAVATNWPLRKAWAKREHRFLIGAGRLLAAGVYLSLHPFLRGLEDNRTAYGWSLASFLPLIAFTLWRQVGDRPVEQNGPKTDNQGTPKGCCLRPRSRSFTRRDRGWVSTVRPDHGVSLVRRRVHAVELYLASHAGHRNRFGHQPGLHALRPKPRSHDRAGAPESVCRCSPRSGLRCPAFSKTP